MTFSKNALTKRLKEARKTQDSVKNLSQFIVHYHNNAGEICQTWLEVFKNASHEVQISLWYVANDVVQTAGNKKRGIGTIFREAFKLVLPKALSYTGGNVRQSSFTKVISVWSQRKVYEEAFCVNLKEIIASTDTAPRPTSPEAPLAERISGTTEMTDNVSASGSVANEENSKEQDERLAALAADYQMSTTTQLLQDFKKLSNEAGLKLRLYEQNNFDVASIGALKNLKEKSEGKRVRMQFETSATCLSDYVADMDLKQAQHAKLLEQLLVAKIYFREQQKEAKIVATAYRQFGSRISGFRKKLNERKKSLPAKSLSSSTAAASEMESETPLDMDLDNDDEESGPPLQTSIIEYSPISNSGFSDSSSQKDIDLSGLGGVENIMKILQSRANASSSPAPQQPSFQPGFEPQPPVLAPPASVAPPLPIAADAQGVGNSFFDTLTVMNRHLPQQNSTTVTSQSSIDSLLANITPSQPVFGLQVTTPTKPVNTPQGMPLPPTPPYFPQQPQFSMPGAARPIMYPQNGTLGGNMFAPPPMQYNPMYQQSSPTFQSMQHGDVDFRNMQNVPAPPQLQPRPSMQLVTQPVKPVFSQPPPWVQKVGRENQSHENSDEKPSRSFVPESYENRRTHDRTPSFERDGPSAKSHKANDRFDERSERFEKSNWDRGQQHGNYSNNTTSPTKSYNRSDRRIKSHGDDWAPSTEEYIPSAYRDGRGSRFSNSSRGGTDHSSNYHSNRGRESQYQDSRSRGTARHDTVQTLRDKSSDDSERPGHRKAEEHNHSRLSVYSVETTPKTPPAASASDNTTPVSPAKTEESPLKPPTIIPTENNDADRSTPVLDDTEVSECLETADKQPSQDSPEEDNVSSFLSQTRQDESVSSFVSDMRHKSDTQKSDDQTKLDAIICRAKNFAKEFEMSKDPVTSKSSEINTKCLLKSKSDIVPSDESGFKPLVAPPMPIALKEQLENSPAKTFPHDNANSNSNSAISPVHGGGFRPRGPRPVGQTSPGFTTPQPHRPAGAPPSRMNIDNVDTNSPEYARWWYYHYGRGRGRATQAPAPHVR